MTLEQKMTTELTSPQVRFIECLKAYINQTLDGEELAGASEEEIWDIISLAFQQQIWPIYYQILSETPAWSMLQENYRAEKELYAFQQLANQIRLIENTAILCNEFENQSIPYIIMKGCSCRRYYPDPDARISSDEDILVRPEDYLRCDELLQGMGYTTEEQFNLHELDSEKDIPYYSEDGEHLLELHVNAIGNYDDRTRRINRFMEGSFEHREQFEVHGHMLWGLDPTYQLMHLMGHFVKHLYEKGVGIRQYLDIVLCIKYDGNRIDWVQIGDFLDETKLFPLFRMLLIMAHQYFDINLLLPGIFERDAITPDREKVALLLLKDILEGGVYGFERAQKLGQMGYYTSAMIEEKNALWVWYILFPDKKRLASKYTIIKKYPILIPAFYVIRWFAIASEYLSGKHDVKNLKRNIEAGKKRAEFLGKL